MFCDKWWVPAPNLLSSSGKRAHQCCSWWSRECAFFFQNRYLLEFNSFVISWAESSYFCIIIITQVWPKPNWAKDSGLEMLRAGAANWLDSYTLPGSKLQNQMEHSFKVLTFNRSLCFLKTIALLGGMMIYELDWAFKLKGFVYTTARRSRRAMLGKLHC